MFKNARGGAPINLVGIVLTAIVLMWSGSTALAQEGETGWTPPSPAERCHRLHHAAPSAGSGTDLPYMTGRSAAGLVLSN